jgi:Protein of unknown function (DUF1571)
MQIRLASVIILAAFLASGGCASWRSRHGLEPESTPSPPAQVPSGEGRGARGEKDPVAGSAGEGHTPQAPSAPGVQQVSLPPTGGEPPGLPAHANAGLAADTASAAANLVQAKALTPVAAAQRLRELATNATARYQQIDSYIARFRRREVVNGQQKPEELMLIKFRKEPWSVYFKWLGEEGRGREVVFVPGMYDNKLHTLLAAGDTLMPAGTHFAVAPDSFLVRSKSRHPIQEAGFGSLVEKFSRLVASERNDGNPGILRYIGAIRRPEFEQPQEAVEQRIPPGSEPGFKNGGLRLWLFDTANSLPVLATAKDDAGKEIEYYCYDRVQYPARLSDNDFNPELIWRVKPAPR